MMLVIRKVPHVKAIPWILGALLAGRAAGACGGKGPDNAEPHGGIGGRSPVSAGPGSDPGDMTGPYADFPATAILDAPAGGAAPPANAGDLFGPAGSGDPSTG